MAISSESSLKGFTFTSHVALFDVGEIAAAAQYRERWRFRAERHFGGRSADGSREGVVADRPQVCVPLLASDFGTWAGEGECASNCSSSTEADCGEPAAARSAYKADLDARSAEVEGDRRAPHVRNHQVRKHRSAEAGGA